MRPSDPEAALWSQARAIFRDEGARGVWFRGIGRLGYRRLLLWSRPTGERHPPSLPEGFEFIEVGPENLTRYLRFRTDQVEAEVRQRWQRGERCHAVMHGETIKHCGWSATTIAWIDFLRCRLMLPRDVVYLFDGVTAAAYQRQGLGGARARFVAGLYGAQGYSRGWSATLPENDAASRFQQRIGSHPIGLLRRWPWSLGWIDRSFPES